MARRKYRWGTTEMLLSMKIGQTVWKSGEEMDAVCIRSIATKLKKIVGVKFCTNFYRETRMIRIVRER